MGQALYRKYRSKTLAEVVGQPHITSTLQNALKKGRISHAYLFTGPRGVGKTSIARILAHEVNGLPYDEQQTHIDIIEIDAASNRGIEEIRDLREKVHNAPNAAKFKVYIIDEVHMLTKQAFNALLKTLEEPPSHAIFILATTEGHKLPETIVSRTQRFSFKPIDAADIAAHLRTIADREHIDVTDEALALMASHGEGSFRDSISMLDQAAAGNARVDAETIIGMLGIPSEAVIDRLSGILESGSPHDLLDTLRDLSEQGVDPTRIAKQLGGRLRRQAADGSITASRELLTPLLQNLIGVAVSADAEGQLEISLLDYVLGRQSNTEPAPPQASFKETGPPAKTPAAEVSAPHKKTERAGPVHKTAIRPAQPADSILDAWPQVLTTVKKRHNTLYGILRMARPALEGDQLTLAFAFAFHQKKMNEEKSKSLLREIVADHVGASLEIRCTIDKSAIPPNMSVVIDTPPPRNEGEEPLDAITSVFGGAEVLEP